MLVHHRVNQWGTRRKQRLSAGEREISSLYIRRPSTRPLHHHTSSSFQLLPHCGYKAHILTLDYLSVNTLALPKSRPRAIIHARNRRLPRGPIAHTLQNGRPLIPQAMGCRHPPPQVMPLRCYRQGRARLIVGRSKI